MSYSASQISQFGAQRLQSARQPRFHSAYGKTQRESDFLVSKPLNFAQHQRGPLFEWQTVNCTSQPRTDLLPGELAVWRVHVLAKDHLAVIANVLVERHLIGPCPPAPPALAVTDLIDDYAENPGTKRRLTAKAVQRPEHAKKDFLRQVERFFPIAKQVRGEAQHEPMMFQHERRVRLFVTRKTTLNQAGFAAGNFRPGDGFGRLDGEISCHRVLPNISAS